jgi:hypothetical protein
MDKAGIPFPFILLCFKKFTDHPLKLGRHVETGELIGIHKPFDRLLQLILVCMVVEPYLFAKPIIPKAIHNVHDGLLKTFVIDHDRPEHPLVPGWVDTIVDGKGQIDGSPHFLSLSADGFGNTTHL